MIQVTETIVEGDNVLLYVGPRKTYLVKAEKGKDFHTHRGFVKFDDLLGKEYGTQVTSSLGFKFAVLKPQLQDFIMKCARQTQIMYPKDIALMVMFSGIGPGSKVVEAGTGTGALTTALAHYAKPTGRVFSYEIRGEFLGTAEKNLRKAGLLEYVEMKNRDVTLGIDESDVDSVILDLAVPWLVIPEAYKSLKPSGTLVSFSPTIDQVVKAVESLVDSGFAEIETIECLMRGMQVERGKTRPHTIMTGHSGYITSARKMLFKENPAQATMPHSAGQSSS